MPPQLQPLVRVFKLEKSFPGIGGSMLRKAHSLVHAVRSVTFEIQRGETLGLVGESGCGKTTTGRLILRLDNPDSGTVEFNGVDLFSLSRKNLRRYRREMQAIFQDPSGSLNPRMTALEALTEILHVHGLCDRQRIPDRVRELFDTVGLPKSYLSHYPSQFSGGQRQRLGIARALAVEPSFIVADEPVSALDVSMQAQILNLLKNLQREFGLTYLFISHDLGVVHYMCDRIAVMYLGELVETGTAEQIFTRPHHPYTAALLKAIPDIDQPMESSLKGDLPAGEDLPKGCGFQSRCPYVEQLCRISPPRLTAGTDRHSVRCHLNAGRGLMKLN